MNPPLFKDRFGREWSIEVSLDLLPALADAGLDLLHSKVDPRDAIQALLNGNAMSVGRLLWVFCSAQAQAAGIDFQGFAKGLNAAALNEGTDAVGFAIAAFVAVRAMRSASDVELENIGVELADLKKKLSRA